MIIFLHGPDTYRSHQKLNEIIEHYQKIHKSGLNLKLLEEDDFSPEHFREVVQTTPMFREKRLMVLKNLLSRLGKEENWPDLIRTFQQSTDIVILYEDSKLNTKSDIFQLLIKNSQWQEFTLLEGEKLKKWIKERCSRLKTEISSQAIEKLIYYLGDDLWQLNNEIKKLASFKSRGEIQPADIELLVKPKIETDIFKTIDALASQNKKEAITLIHQHLEKGDNPLYLLSMINFQFRNLLMVRDLMEKNRPYYWILKSTKLHPLVVKKTYQQAKKFSFLELKKIYQRIFQVDLSIKTGKVTPETALDLLIAEI